MRQTADPWQVRVEDESGLIHGAGTLLGGDHVLTCAHVVEQASDGDGVVWIRVKGSPALAYPARVRPGCWSACLDDHTGDVAVLDLAEPVPGAPRPGLRATWTKGEPVWLFGYPEEIDNGQEVTAEVRVLDFAGERAQLNAVAEQRVRQGFSGAPAVAADGRIVGIVASVRDPDQDSAWMITVTTLRRYASAVLEDYLDHPASVDPQFRRPAPRVVEAMRDPVRVALTRALIAWLESAGEGGVCAVGGGAAVSVIARLVGLTVPEYRDAAPRQTVAGAPAGTLPRLGAVHAAVDAAGKTAEQVARGIAASLSLADGTGGDLADRVELLGSSVAIVVNEVDAAEDPLELLNLVLEPIAIRAPSTGVRLLLGFRGGPPGQVRAAAALNLAGPDTPVSGAPEGNRPAPSSDRDEFARRIDRLVERGKELAAAERAVAALHDRVAPRILGAPRRRLASASALAVRIQIIRDLIPAGTGPEPASRPTARTRPDAELEACERMAADAVDRAARTTHELEDLLARRERLRGRLRAYRALAASHGLIEELGDQYQAAWVLLYSGAADLRLAGQTVTAYHTAVRRAIEEGDGS